jgi:two-component system, cell cycle sensor histidine kinase and response regulator CckA
MDQTTAPFQKDTKTILVVDDEAIILTLVSRMLDDSEYNILTASSGAQGLQRSRELRDEIHLLISDVKMPGMSGVELATTMTIERPQLKVLLISGFTDEGLELNDEWQFLSKPFAVPQLQALVLSLVSANRKSDVM